jgi:hypothetical protein
MGGVVTKFILVAFACASIALLVSHARGGIDSESNTDGPSPAAEIYSINETQRQAQVAQQLDLNYRMLWSSGYGPWYPERLEPGFIWGYRRGVMPIEQPIGHQSEQVAPNRWIYRPLYARDVEPAVPVEDVGAGPILPAPVEILPAPASVLPIPAPGPSAPEPIEPKVPRPRPQRPVGPREF